jgi:glycosyltransferase involved in cell wall biosynthesis
MGRRGREIAVERFSIQRVVEKTSEVYRDLTAEAGRTTPAG